MFFGMFQGILISLCCVLAMSDTLDVATVSAGKTRAVASVAPVRSIYGEAISRQGIIGLNEALQTFAGVSVKDYGGVGGLKTVSVRNMGAAHTAVMYDGIAISNAQNGQVDISRFNLDDISSVSLNIGAPDGIFMPARHLASSGILSIETGRSNMETGRTEVSARLSAASFNTYNPYVSVRCRPDDRFFIALSAHGLYSKGNYPFELENVNTVINERRTGSDVRRAGAEIDFHADWKARGVLKVKGICDFSERGLPGPVVYYTVNPSERLWNREVMANASYELSPVYNLKFHADLGFSHSYDRHVDTDPAYSEPQVSRYVQNEYTVSARVLYESFRFWNFSAAADFFVNTLDADIPECPYPVRMSFAGALTGQYRREYLCVTAGLVCNSVQESVMYGEAPEDRFALSPYLGANWMVVKGLHLRASVKEGYRLPTFNDLYYARVGNRNLRPERAWQFNAGVAYEGKWKWGRGCVNIDAYYNMVKDKITAIPTMFIWRMRNTGQVQMYGTDVSVTGEASVCRWLDIFVNGSYSWQYAADVTDRNAKNYGHQIPYTPRHCGSASLTSKLPWISITYRLTASGERYFSQQNLLQYRLDPYLDHCISVSRTFRLKNRYSLELAVEALNLSDVNYEIINNYPMSGRSYRLTLKFNYL